MHPSVFPVTRTLNPTTKKFSGHISGQVQLPKRSPLVTSSTDRYFLALKVVPARCRKTFSPQTPRDSTASVATAESRRHILTPQTVRIRAAPVSKLLWDPRSWEWFIYRDTPLKDMGINSWGGFAEESVCSAETFTAEQQTSSTQSTKSSTSKIHERCLMLMLQSVLTWTSRRKDEVS